MKATVQQFVKWMACLVAILLVSQAGAQEPSILKTQRDKDSYAIGADLAKNLKRQGVQVEVDPLLQGIRDVISGGKPLMAEDELRETLRVYQAELRKKQIQTKGGTAAIAEENRDNARAFLARNKTNEGIITLPSGLQYKILKSGNGPKPTAEDTVECKFRGCLINGTEFNNSERSGKSVTLKMSDAIAGTKEAIQLMPVGSKWQLFIPSELAYGEKGVMGSKNRYQIPPNAMIIFEMELLAIKTSPDPISP